MNRATPEDEKRRMLKSLLAIPPDAKGRDARISELAEKVGSSRATAYRLLKRSREGMPLVTKRKPRGASVRVKGRRLTARAWNEKGLRAAISILVGNSGGRTQKKVLYERLARQAQVRRMKIGTYSSFLDLSNKLNPSSFDLMTTIESLKEAVSKLSARII